MMLKPTDKSQPGDAAKPLKPAELSEKAQAQVEKLTRRLERQGVEPHQAQSIAEKVDALAKGPVAHDDWMNMESDRFSLASKSALEQQGLTPETVLADYKQAEAYTAQVFEHEGIPDGNGGTEQIKGIVPGHFDQSGHGIDLVAADQDGSPVPIEVKKYQQASGAHLGDYSVTRLEPEVERWRRQNELPVQQMDDLWARDRWLKLIKSSEDQSRLRRAGIAEKYLNYRKLRRSPDLPEWQDILDRRTTVIVSEGAGDTGKRLFKQAVAQGRSKRVIKIQV